MNDERRSRSRCPVCGGPTKELEDAPDGLRCRNSLCIHNYSDHSCPRCGQNAVKNASRGNDGKTTLSCSECLATWVVD